MSHNRRVGDVIDFAAMPLPGFPPLICRFTELPFLGLVELNQVGFLAVEVGAGVGAQQDDIAQRAAVFVRAGRAGIQQCGVTGFFIDHLPGLVRVLSPQEPGARFGIVRFQDRGFLRLFQFNEPGRGVAAVVPVDFLFAQDFQGPSSDIFDPFAGSRRPGKTGFLHRPRLVARSGSRAGLGTGWIRPGRRV